MKITLPVTWEVYAEITVNAESVEAAIRDFNPDNHHLPTVSEYVDSSLRLSSIDPAEVDCYQPPLKKK